MKSPILTVDIIIEQDENILLIDRKFKPLGLTLPGGHVNYNETIEHAAKRETKEETGLDIRIRDILSVYSDPKRDPRKHAVSVVFIAEANGKAKAGSDAKDIKYISRKNIPKNIAFDHKKIIDDYFRQRGKNNFERLLKLTEKLRAPNGCPWDKSQTFESLIKDFHEESEELKEAIRKKDMDNLEEEIGDVCFTLALIMQIGMEKKLFTPESVFERIAEKIVARHTWVFGNDTVQTTEEALVLWKKNKARLKKQEQKKKRNL